MSDLATKVMELIEEGKNVLGNQIENSKPDVILFVGMSRVGKSTLINYINDVSLECYLDNDDRKFKLKAKDSTRELPGIKMGQSTWNSCTRHPGTYTPLNMPFTYVDMPGFGDTGSPAQDIANAYFRSAITEKAINLKIVLVVNYSDLTDNPRNLPKTLKDLANFIEGIKGENRNFIEQIKRSISIVVTRIDDPTTEKKDRIKKLERDITRSRKALKRAEKENNIEEANEECQIIREKSEEIADLMNQIENESPKQNVANSLRNFIANSPSLNKITNMREILTHIVDENQYAVFSNPTKICNKDPIEAVEIQNLIHNQTTFISKQVANIGIKVSDENSGEVLKAINGLSFLKEDLVKNIDKDIGEKLNEAFKNDKDNKFQAIKIDIEIGKDYLIPCTLEAFFYNLLQGLNLSEETIKKYKEFNKLLTLLVGLLPEIDCANYSDKKNWVAELGLNNIFEAHIKKVFNTPKVKFDKGKLTIQGYQIKTSQVDVEIQKFAGIKDIEIQALHTITIDNDLDTNNSKSKCAGKLHGVNLTMIAPNVMVNGNKTIDLSGGVGGVHAGIPGNSLPGAPGLPGKSSGNLFIMTEELFDADSLTVILDGGKGGKGQRGGDGSEGAQGSHAVKNHEGTWEVTNERGAHLEWMKNNGIEVEDRLKKGEPGSQGGSAGNGGAGGTGGNKGICTIISIKNSAINAEIKSQDGNIGIPGEAGTPGLGGLYGWGLHNSYRWWNGGKDHHWEDKWQDVPPKDRGPSGNPGYAGTNKLGLQAPEPIVINSSLNLLNYKIFLAQAAEYLAVIDEFFNAFGKHCASIKATELKTTTKDLLEEANALEKYSLELGKTIDFAPFYYSLLARIQEFALDPVRTPEETKVLEYLYVATLGSIARLKAADDNLLVINIHQYVKNLVDEDFAELKTIKADQLKQYYTNQYQEGIEDKIKEAQSYLEILKKDIHSRQQAIEPQIRKLTQEVNKLITDKTKEKSALQEKRRELEAALYKKAVFGIMSIAVQGVGMAFPPAGPIVAGVVNAGLTMAANPTIDTATNFANKVVDMKSQLGKLPTGTTNAPEVELFKKVQEMAKTVAPLIENARDLLNQQHEGDARLQQLDNQITSVNAYITELDIYLKTVRQSLSKYLESMVSEVQSFQTALQDKSLVGLDFSKLEIKRFFASMKQNIKALTGQFEASDGFEDIVNKMEEAMDVSLNISSRVQEYCEHIAFANFIAHLHSANVQNVVVSAEYQQAVDELKVKLQSSIVQEAYYRAIAAAKQWAFPFAEKFLSAIPKLDTTDELIMEANLKALRRRLKDYKTCITDMDQAVMLGRFNTVAPNIPFFTWSYEQYPQKIEALLKGKEVILSADVVKSKIDAVKFNKIGISFTGMDDTRQAEFDALLQNNYSVSLEHSGTSYYKFFENVYQLQNDKPLKISYSFKMCPDTTPEHPGMVWKKMAKGDSLLSPYTSWVIKIEPLLTATSTANLFDKFNDVKDQIKVNLTGEGSYVDTSKVNSNLNLDKYYHTAANQEPLEISHALARNGLFKAKKPNNNQASVEDSKNNTPQPKM